MCPAEARVTLGVAAAREGDVETAVEEGERAPRCEHGPAVACPRSRLRRIGDEESPAAVGELACGKPYRPFPRSAAEIKKKHRSSPHRNEICHEVMRSAPPVRKYPQGIRRDQHDAWTGPGLQAESPVISGPDLVIYSSYRRAIKG